jgi:hypothetical protein
LARSFARRGLATVLAMLYLALFAVLAVGFFAATSMSAQISRNERRLNDAQLGAESGLQFMRYQLGQVDITTTTLQADLLPKVCAELARLMDGTGNMGGNAVQITDGTINIPSPTGTVPLEAGGGDKRFRATITQSGTFLILTVTGFCSDPNITRTVQMKYAQAPRASALFDFGVASKGKIVTGGSAIVVGQGDPARGSVLSTSMTDPTPVVIGGKMVSGDISVTNPAANVTYAGASIGGTKDPVQIEAKHIHKGVTAPDFPDIDTSAYAAYATTAYTGSGGTLTNVYIPAGMNPSFSGGTINGVLYVKAPNRVSFTGNTVINGAIVVENNVAYDPTRNSISFGGNVTVNPISTTGLGLPAGEESLTGAFLLAPGFAASFTGSFGTVGGHVIASGISFTGDAGGTVQGSVINLASVEMDINGSADIVIAATGTTNYPTGVTFGVKYVPLPDTYVEQP